MAALVDTNVLVYRFDARDSRKQRIAADLIRDGLKNDSLRVSHQALVEFYAVVTRPIRGYGPLLEHEEALREIEEMFAQYDVLFPNEAVVLTALRGVVAYQLPWYDAHLWAYAEVYGLAELISEDFQHGRIYGTVRAVDPFKRA